MVLALAAAKLSAINAPRIFRAAGDAVTRLEKPMARLGYEAPG